MSNLESLNFKSHQAYLEDKYGSLDAAYDAYVKLADDMEFVIDDSRGTFDEVLAVIEKFHKEEK